MKIFKKLFGIKEPKAKENELWTCEADNYLYNETGKNIVTVRILPKYKGMSKKDYNVYTLDCLNRMLQPYYFVVNEKALINKIERRYIHKDYFHNENI
jgi:hypothetical protein